jgi:hypothetical protein
LNLKVHVTPWNVILHRIVYQISFIFLSFIDEH